MQRLSSCCAEGAHLCPQEGGGGGGCKGKQVRGTGEGLALMGRADGDKRGGEEAGAGGGGGWERPLC